MLTLAAGHREPRVLVVRTDRLGETLLSLPTVQALRHAQPRAVITLMVAPILCDLLQGLPGVDEIVPEPVLTGPWWHRATALARLWRERHPEMVLIANPKKEYHLAAWLARIPVRIGYDHKWSWCLTHRVADRKAIGERHEVDSNLDLIRCLGWPIGEPQWPLPSFDQERHQALRLLQAQGIDASAPLIAVHPWTSTPLKRWPLERFQALMQRLLETLPVSVVVVGGQDAAGRVESVLPQDPRAANLTGRLSLRQLAALLQHARVLISSDSGPVHLAAAVQTRTVVLFGTANPAMGPRRWGPWGAGHTVIWKPSMEAVTVDEVVAAVSEQLTCLNPNVSSL